MHPKASPMIDLKRGPPSRPSDAELNECIGGTRTDADGSVA